MLSISSSSWKEVWEVTSTSRRYSSPITSMRSSRTSSRTSAASIVGPGNDVLLPFVLDLLDGDRPAGDHQVAGGDRDFELLGTALQTRAPRFGRRLLGGPERREPRVLVGCEGGERFEGLLGRRQHHRRERRRARL